jgi:hypothetical protein
VDAMNPVNLQSCTRQPVPLERRANRRTAKMKDCHGFRWMRRSVQAAAAKMVPRKRVQMTVANCMVRDACFACFAMRCLPQHKRPTACLFANKCLLRVAAMADAHLRGGGGGGPPNRAVSVAPALMPATLLRGVRADESLI